MFIENTEELAQNKLLLLYLINKSDEDLNKNSITEFMLEKDYMNYFLVQQYLSELVESELVEIVKVNSNSINDIYQITEKGELILSYFKERILPNFKEDVSKEFVKTKEDIKKETEVISEYYQKNNGQYVVNLKLVENEDILFSIYLDVADPDQVESISNHWKENTDEVYQGIIKILINDQ